jgi:Mg-chelatase subunit ChlD
MERNLAFEADPSNFRQKWQEREQSLSHQIEAAREVVERVSYTRKDLLSIAALTSSFQVDGHRADLVILKAACAHAAFEGRTSITEIDIALAAELALPHRLRRGPFHQVDVNIDDLHSRIEQIQTETESSQLHEEALSEESSTDKKKRQLKVIDQETAEESPEAGQMEPSKQNVSDSIRARWWEGGDKVKIGESFTPRTICGPLDRMSRRHGGRRTQSRTERKRGRYIMSRPANDKREDIAFDATFRAAAPYQKDRKNRSEHVAFAIEPSDLQRKVRIRKAANLIIFLVDASWSMAVAERMSATKGAILSLLTDAYQRRDRVGLVVFQKDRALTILPPTNSIELAQRALADIPVGGKTPLSAGLQLSYEIFERERVVHPDTIPLLILLTDGAGNVSIGNLPPQEEAHLIADHIREANIRTVVINMEHAAFDQGLANLLAERLGGPCYTLHQLKAEHLYQTVRQEMKA